MIETLYYGMRYENISIMSEILVTWTQ